MSTVDKDLADRLIAVNGKFESDPQIHSIVEYDTRWGGVAYGVNYEEVNKYTPSPYVNNPRVYWTWPGSAGKQGS